MKTESEQISLSVFFPVYNEEKNIKTVITQADLFLSKTPLVQKYEIIIINDGSDDASKQIVEEMIKTNQNIRLINHERNLGYGRTLQTGFEHSQYEYVFFTDSDGQFDISELDNFIEEIKFCDVVVGFRQQRQDNLLRKINAKAWNILNRMIFGLRVRDIDCAFKLFKKEVINNVQLKSSGAMISAELLTNIIRKGYKIKELPVSHYPRTEGEATGAHILVILKSFSDLASFYFNLNKIGIRQLLIFLVVGIINTVLDVSAYFILSIYVFSEENYLYAKMISYLLGTVNSFILNRYWTFGHRHLIGFAEVTRFYSLVLFSLLINIISMYVFVSILHVNDKIAVFVSLFITTLVNFLVSKYWVFKKVAHD